MTEYEAVIAELYAGVDADYKAFNNKIINCDYPSLGVRTPVIKKLAKRVPIARRDEVMPAFFSDPVHTKIYDTVLFAGCLAARKGDYLSTREYLSRLVPMFGSWAHTDSVVPCLDWMDVPAVLDDFAYLLDCRGQYEKRFYIIYMLDYCLTDEFIDRTLETLSSRVEFGDYYVDMAAAWLVAEALVKQFDKTLPLVERRVFPKFVHNKAIQKARESFRIDGKVKEYLKGLGVRR